MWGQGQTPAKNLLKLRVIDETKGRPAKWGHMCIRQSLIPFAMSLVFFIPYLVIFSTGIVSGFSNFVIFCFLACLGMGLAIHIVDIVWLFGPKRKRLIDYWAKTIVVNEAHIVLTSNMQY